jgi:hypothetical protein
VQRISSYFKTLKTISNEEIRLFAPLYGDLRVNKLLNTLEDHSVDGISLIEAHSWVENDYALLDRLTKENFIINNAEDRIFLFSKLRFFQFTPKYLIPILSQRFENGDISMNQLMTHLELLE